jgi:hypothetical protein
MMGYFALAIGMIFLGSGITGKLLPMKRPALFDIPQGVHRAIYVWLGVVFAGVGLCLLIAGRKG